MKRRLLSTVLFVAVLVLHAQAATWYVATSGNDSNSCLTTASPCLTFNGAYQKATGGDSIEVAAGTYGSQTFTNKTISTDVIIQPASGATVNVGTLTFDGATHVEVREMTASGWNVSFNSNTAFITLRNVDIHGAFFLNGGKNLTMIGGSTGPFTNQGNQIAPGGNGWQGQGVNITLDGILFHDFTRDSASVHMECLQIAGTTNLIIRNSKFTKCAINDVQLTEYNGSGAPVNALLENNWFDNTLDVGTSIAGTPAFNLNSNISSTGNVTLRFNSSVIGWALQPASMSGVVYGNAVAGGIYDAGIGCKSNATYAYNVTQGQSCGPTNSNASPKFVNAAAFNLNLQAGSPAINFVPLAQPFPTTDIGGLARPQGSANDAGASEFASGVSANAPLPPTNLVGVVQ